jgi:peptide methionine sulfoxide reductase MsrB
MLGVLSIGMVVNDMRVSAPVPLRASLLSMKLPVTGGELARGTDLMRPKAHGTCAAAVRSQLRWGCDRATADHICCFNRHYAEPSGYYHSDGVAFVQAMAGADAPIVFCDSVSGEPLFVAPIGRTSAEFLKESYAHGWPSFRSQEVNWALVRCLPDGEVVSNHGTHLGHNIPDEQGHRLCINLCSVAGKPRAVRDEDAFREALRGR